MRFKRFATNAIDEWFIRRSKSVVYPAMVGMAVFFAYPSLIGHQDVASLLPEPIQQRWLANITQSPGQTARIASLGSTGSEEVDEITTGSLAKSTTGETTVEVAVQPKRQAVPQRINRDLKGDRVVSTPTQLPPARFSAGSVLDQHSMLKPIAQNPDFELAFVKKRSLGEAIELASLFHGSVQEPIIDGDLPVTVASLVRESAPNILAFSQEPVAKRSPFAAVLQEDDAPINLIPKLGKHDHSWAARPLPLAAFGEQEQHCLTAGIYFEARGEPVRGQAAVAQVILNRVKNPAYPDSICGVVYQNERWRNRCQFSFACDGIAERVKDSRRWDVAKFVARETTEGRIWLTEVGSSTHYHATYVRPKWARSMKRVGRIGLHIFYRTRGGGWS